ncbi:hypothetical protein [Streptomyces sp. NPDC001070]
MTGIPDGRTAIVHGGGGGIGGPGPVNGAALTARARKEPGLPKDRVSALGYWRADA